jgi:uncharacterized peroxidase-related enzyme
MSDQSDNQRPCWIDTIEPEDASAELSGMYNQVGAVHNKIHNLYRAFSLQPAPLLAADQHYRDVLHNEENHSDPWFLELLASQAAIIADCHYALTNHGTNFKSLLGDTEKGDSMLQAVREDSFADNPLFTAKQAALLEYGAKLCRTPQAMSEADIDALRAQGVSDTEILEAVQATSCFAYWVRFINALGIQLGNESIGMYSQQNPAT